ncbi:MAG TPA: SDR family oxidoreductase [Actinomycetota bacterium]|jgi:NAD(P)-dependent dehydrogenase (short-subunit alcohol dehydrogenase family)|nr:SDR family oxidoreductase [Actinomycetota bacterium]
MERERHAGKTAIVTGAGNGIGRATVRQLAAEGAKVIGCDLNEQALTETSAMLDDRGLSATLAVADITSQQDVERLVADAGGSIDVLANVAGIMDHFVPLGELDDDLWDRVLAVNLSGVMRLTRAVLPGMVERASGAIVTVASKASTSAGASGAAYAASKHGVIGLVKSIAYFYGPQGIRSNAVLPGGVTTAIGATAAPRSEWAFQRAQLSMATMPPAADADRIAEVVSWLASDEASFVNGATVAADGGWATA